MSINISVAVESIQQSAKNIQTYKEEVDIEMDKLIKIVDILRSDVWIGKNAQAFFEKFTEFRNRWNGLTNLALNSFTDGLNTSAKIISETQQQTRSRIRTLGGEVGGKMMGIATSAAGAKAGSYVNSELLYSDVFNDPSVKFRSHDNDVYAVERDGTVIGYTLKENVDTTVTSDGGISSEYTSENPWHQSDQYKAMADNFVQEQSSVTDVSTETPVNTPSVDNQAETASFDSLAKEPKQSFEYDSIFNNSSGNNETFSYDSIFNKNATNNTTGLTNENEVLGGNAITTEIL